MFHPLGGVEHGTVASVASVAIARHVPASSVRRRIGSGLAIVLVASITAVMAPAADAQSLHRCEVNGRVTFSDRPCPGASVEAVPTPAPRPSASMQAPPAPSSAPKSSAPKPPAAAPDADPARRCAEGNASACRTQDTLARHQRDMDELGRLCTGGSALACDALACVETNDRNACARAQGRAGSAPPTAPPHAAAGTPNQPPAATGWAETGRRVGTRPGRRLDGGATGERYTVVSIRCGHGGQGAVEIGPGGARIGGQGAPYTSLNEAADLMCSRGR